MRSVVYRRVSDLTQVEGHSLDAQERVYNEYSAKRDWTPVADYCEAGRSAHVDTIEGRPAGWSLCQTTRRGNRLKSRQPLHLVGKALTGICVCGGDGGGSISLNSKRLLLSSPIVYPAPGLLTQ